MHGLPVAQHCQPSAELLLSARDAYGSLNKSKMTASLPLKVFATDVQNGIAWAASGIGFWQVACADEHPAELPSEQPCELRHDSQVPRVRADRATLETPPFSSDGRPRE